MNAKNNENERSFVMLTIEQQSIISTLDKMCHVLRGIVKSGNDIQNAFPFRGKQLTTTPLSIKTRVE